MLLAQLGLDAAHQILQLRHGQAVVELDAQRRDYLVRRKLRGEDALDVAHAGLAPRRLEQRIAELVRRALADQQGLALAREQDRDGRKDRADQERSGAVYPWRSE